MSQAAAVFVFEDRDTGTPALVSSRKVITMGTITTHGCSAHAGEVSEIGVNAIAEMSHKVLKLQKLNNIAAGRMVNIGRIQGGVTGSQIPAICESELNIRFNTPEDGEALEREVISTLHQQNLPEAATEFQLQHVRPPLVKTSTAAQLFGAYTQATAELGRHFEERAVGSGSVANLTAALGIPTLDGFGCAVEGLHTDDEYILKASLVESMQNLTLFFYRFWGGSSE